MNSLNTTQYHSNDLKTLLRLQEIDSDIERLKKNLTDLPAKLTEQVTVYQKHEENLLINKTKIEEIQKKTREQERETATANDTITKLNIKLNVVKTNKEYETLLAEIDGLKQKIDAWEDEELALLDKLDESKDIFIKEEQRVKEEKLKFEEEKIQIAADKVEVEKTMATIEEKRDKVRKQINDDLYKEYKKIFTLRDKLAAVRVKKNVCGGCHQVVRPQLLVKIKLNNTLISCPYCNRFLFWEGNNDDEEGK